MKDDALSEGTSTTDDVSTVLLYRDRSWSEVPNPIKLCDGDTDWSQILYRHGWMHSTTIGDDVGISIDLHGRRPCAEPCRYMWLVEYNTSGICTTIVIERWQDLIDFLAHVSSTMLVAVLPPDISMVLHELFEKTPHRVEQQKRWREDSQREQREKRKKQEPVECRAFMCLPERNPSHYVDGRHRPIKNAPTSKAES